VLQQGVGVSGGWVLEAVAARRLPDALQFECGSGYKPNHATHKVTCSRLHTPSRPVKPPNAPPTQTPQDLLPLSSRLPDVPAAMQQVNEPSNPEHYWRYRLHVSLEQIREDSDLRHLLSDMLQAAQRYHGEAPRMG